MASALNLPEPTCQDQSFDFVEPTIVDPHRGDVEERGFEAVTCLFSLVPDDGNIETFECILALGNV